MISVISWLQKGVAKSVPVEASSPSSASSSQEENNEASIENDTNNYDEASQALAAAEAVGRPSSTINTSKFQDIAHGLRDLEMEHYDDEDDGIELFSPGDGNIYYPSNDMDPYINDKNDTDLDELEDITIRENDEVIICACMEEEVGYIQVWIYEGSNNLEENLYIHHDIMVSAYPLCTTWLDYPFRGGERGNFIAVGSMEPAIEIWDLDVLNEVKPITELGGVRKQNKKKKKKKSTVSIKHKKGSHTDSVLGLDWNKKVRNVIASAGGDKKVKIWDLVTGKCSVTMEHHTDKVQTVRWNHNEPEVLLSGSFDQSVVMVDGRMPSNDGFKWMVGSDVECLAWDPHAEHSFVVSLEDGKVKGYDVRMVLSDSKPRFVLDAHDKAVSAMSYNPLYPNLLATGSVDKTVKLWNLIDEKPRFIVSKNPNAGAIFTASFSESSPHLLAMGGSQGKPVVWNISSELNGIM